MTLGFGRPGLVPGRYRRVFVLGSGALQCTRPTVFTVGETRPSGRGHDSVRQRPVTVPHRVDTTDDPEDEGSGRSEGPRRVDVRSVA